MKMKIDWHEVAQYVLFGCASTSLLMDRYGIEFRKNKSVKDLKNAIRKAHKNGNLKTEFEIDMLSLYLSQTFKKRKTK